MFSKEVKLWNISGSNVQFASPRLPDVGAAQVQNGNLKNNLFIL
jgi:hypothetical protein